MVKANFTQFIYFPTYRSTSSTILKTDFSGDVHGTVRCGSTWIKVAVSSSIEKIKALYYEGSIKSQS